jgi:hypothetical protein
VTKDPCRGCTCCCRALAVYADAEDVQAEPRILERGQWDARKKRWRLCPIEDSPGEYTVRCPFLESWGCGIYPTRPTVCRAFKAGSKACAEARARHGKGPIE